MSPKPETEAERLARMVQEDIDLLVVRCCWEREPPEGGWTDDHLNEIEARFRAEREEMVAAGVLDH